MLNPYFILAAIGIYLAGCWSGYELKSGQVEKEQVKAALAASYTETERAHKTTDIVSGLLNLPALAGDDVVASRLFERSPDRCGLPTTTRSVPASARNAALARDNQKLARELKACVMTADLYTGLRETWLANEAKP